uniref:Uncharacterized protein n=1 Tax=Rhizophora mucronata TaxID=61149 RepID=A0A2P2QMW8_RHIMU
MPFKKLCPTFAFPTLQKPFIKVL